MARITVEDCLDNVDNRFELVMLATKRARQLATGGKEPMVKEDSDKATVIALREIADGLVTDDVLQEPVEDEIAEVFEAGTANAGLDVAEAGLEAVAEESEEADESLGAGPDADEASEDEA